MGWTRPSSTSIDDEDPSRRRPPLLPVSPSPAGAHGLAPMKERIAAVQKVERQLAQHRSHGSRMGLLLVRLLQLREFNILFGYGVGQGLLDAAARLIGSVLRPADQVLRSGEGEFLVLLPDVLSPNHALLAAHRVVRAFQQPLVVEGQGMLATVAVGVAIHPEHDDSAEGLCRRADIAYGHALRSGEHAAVYEPDDRFLDVPYAALRGALEDGQLQVHLQPIVETRSGRVVGAESLARWSTPALGNIGPDIFVPLAEQTGLIGEMTRWSLNTTLRHASDARFGDRGMHVSLNLSPRVFLDAGVGEQLLGALRLWDIPTRAVVLEVTEGAVMEDPALSAMVLERMRGAGMGIAIDDFGVGQSSFSYLRQFPANEIKIDQSFIRDMVNDRRSAQLVGAMIELAHRLDMRVVAEGVEDEATLKMLASMDCDLVQGFHIGRPQAARDFLAQLPPA